MFERFSGNARQLMSGAIRAAERLAHQVVDTEHLLLGLLELPDASGVRLLRDLDVDVDTLRDSLASLLPRGDAVPDLGSRPFSAEVRRVLELACEEAAELGHRYVGTMHMLQGLVRAGGTATELLTRTGVTADVLRRELDRLVDDRPPSAAERRNLRLLLISNSTMHGGGYLAHCAHEIRHFLGGPRRVAFVPYALADHAAYAAKAREAFAQFGCELFSLHERNHHARALDDADAVFVGGGNTFRLLSALHHYGLVDAIRAKACDGMQYIGSSAGTNVATPSIRTTNDMPIVQPPTFAALQLVPFQINPHYLDPDPNSKHMGETREERLRQFHEEHATPVLGLREGCLLLVEGERMELRGSTGARLFRRGQSPQEFVPPCEMSFLLHESAAR